MPDKILICDDDEGILDLLDLVLSDDYSVIPEINSLNVGSILQREQPDLVILDLWMPVLSGDQVLQAIRKNTATANLPVIVISASHDGQHIAMDAGADAFIAKPFDIDVLLNTVKDVLTRGHQAV